MTKEEIELLKWAIKTINSFTAPDRPNGAYKFIYTPNLGELRNLVERYEARLNKEQQEPVELIESFSLLLWDYQELEYAFEKATGGKWIRKSNTPQRTWVGLTEEEIETLIHRFDGDPHTLLDEVNARLKRKNT